MNGVPDATQLMPTDPQVATFCRDVSERFGPGGSAGMTESTAIKYVELGNETTLDPRFQGTDAAFTAFARAYTRDYARRVKTPSHVQHRLELPNHLWRGRRWL